MKTVSIGIRFLPEELEEIKKATGLTTAQQVVGFLIGFWKDNRLKQEQALPSHIETKAAVVKNRKVEEKKAPAEKKIDPPLARKTYQDYLREAETTKDAIAFRAEVKADKSIGPNQQTAIYARIKK